MASAIPFVIGASGAGKTSAVEQLATRDLPGVRCFFFDRTGVPSVEAMRRDFGGGEEWQAHATKQWVHQLATDGQRGVSVLDGQTRPSFINAALADARGLLTRTVLLDCSSERRADRLAARGQSEIATPEMDAWAAYLRTQAEVLGLPAANTSAMSILEVADILERHVVALGARVAIES